MLPKKNLKINPQKLPDTPSLPKKVKLTATVNVLPEKIQDREENEARREIGKIVADGIDFIGMKFPKENVCKKIGEFIYKDYGFITFKDLEDVFEAVIRGDIDIPNAQYQTFSVKTMSDILKEYCSRRKPKNAPVEDTPVDTEKARKEFIELIRKTFLAYKKTTVMVYPYAAAAMYDFLDKQGYINLDIDTKKQLYIKAKLILHSEREKQLSTIFAFDKLLLSMESEEVRVKGIAKRLALLQYFDTIDTLELS